jgi:PAS domain S-box-containing protein
MYRSRLEHTAGPHPTTPEYDGAGQVRPTIITAMLVVMCLSAASIIHDPQPGVGLALHVTFLVLCGIFVGGVAVTHISKMLTLSSRRRGLTESESFLRKQQAALWRLTKSKYIHGGVFEDAVREVTEAAAQTLEVERAGVWLFSKDKSCLRCHDVFERSANRHSQGLELSAMEYPVYFDELSAERVIAANDATHDPRTKEFTRDYLTPLGITALLHTPIQSGGRMVGVMCHAHVGIAHEWTLEEQQFANSMANLVSLALEATERLQVEVALRKSEERVRSIIDTALDAVIGMDERGHILDWNRRAETIFGWTREEAIGRELGETIIPSQYREAHRRGLQHFLRSGEGAVLNKRIEITGLRRDGMEFPIELAISPLKTATGYEFNAFVQDISERKRAEEELRSAKESAEAANRAKSQFLANMSHEIRTPMNGVLGMIDLMLATTLTSKQKRFAETVRQSGQNLLRIVNEILDFAKVEAGRLTLEQVDFDVYEIIEEIIDLVAERAQSKGLTLACEIDEQVPAMLKGDPGRLRQILINLIGNAIKFTEQGEVVVRVQVEAGPQETPQSDDGAILPREDEAARDPRLPIALCRLRVSVTDTGIGIPAHAQANIFEPFAQGDGSTTRKYGGTGLGLAIVKQLAEMMNGTVAVESIHGRGSTFSFTAQFHMSTKSSSTEIRRQYDLEGLRVLIVDSNPTTRSILENQLKAWRMHYGSAESGAEALSFLQYKTGRGTPYDLAIVDAQLPDMDPVALTRAIKAQPGTGGLRLVVLTAVTRAEDVEVLQQVGVQALLTKPFRQSRLYDCLATVMGGSPEEQAALCRIVTHQVKAPTLSHGVVLLAEDNPVNQEVALGMLEALGCHVDLATNGREVLEALKRKTYDVILMDCQMPEMDGFEATRRIRDIEARGKRQAASGNNPSDFPLCPLPLAPCPSPSRIPIVAVTAHAITGDRERCLAAGMDDYLSKPFMQDQLQTLLLRWIPTERGRKQEGSMFDVRRSSHESRTPDPEPRTPDPAPRTPNLESSPVSCANVPKDRGLEQEGSAYDVRHSSPEWRTSDPEPRTSNLEPSLVSYANVPTIDPRAWESIRSLQRPGHPDMLCKVIDKYLTSSRQLIETMRLAVPQHDAAALHRMAHSLKSSSATLGALRLAALCKEAEAMGRTNTLEGMPPLWEQLEAEYGAVQEALTAELNQVRT